MQLLHPPSTIKETVRKADIRIKLRVEIMGEFMGILRLSEFISGIISDINGYPAHLFNSAQANSTFYGEYESVSIYRKTSE